LTIPAAASVAPPPSPRNQATLRGSHRGGCT